MSNEPMSVGDWITTLVVLSIPIVGFIMLIYWAASDSSNINRKNFCIAGIVLSLLWVIVIGAVMSMGLLAGIPGGAGM